MTLWPLPESAPMETRAHSISTLLMALLVTACVSCSAARDDRNPAAASNEAGVAPTQSMSILILDQTPSWEFRYLSEYLSRQPQVESTAILLRQHEAPAFDAHDLSEKYDTIVLGQLDSVAYQEHPALAKELAAFTRAGGRLVCLAEEFERATDGAGAVPTSRSQPPRLGEKPEESR